MRVLIAVVPLSGHAAPVTGLAAELVARGHDVRVRCGSRHLAVFEAAGARATPWSAGADYDEQDLAAGLPGVAGSPARRMVAMVRDGFIGTAPEQVRDLRADLDREPADVLLADSMCFGGHLTAQLTGLPWATINVLPFNQVDGGPPPGLTVPPARGAAGRWRDLALWAGYRVLTAPFRRAYGRVRREVGLPSDHGPYGSDLLSPWLVLATGCPLLAEAEGRLVPQAHYVGVLPPIGVARAPAERLTLDRPLVVVTQGTLDTDPDELLRPSLAGLADLDVEVLATTGRRGATDLGIASTRARVADVVDFPTVLPQTSVLVSNGGWGGVLAALAAGVPLVVAPSTAADKPYIARRIARAGVGINLRTRTPRARAVKEAVQRVLADPGYAERAALVAADLAARGGVTRAAELVEELGATRSPVLRA